MKLHHLFGVVVAASLATVPARAQTDAYIAIGDSVGFGVTTVPTFTQPSNGDRGYVSRYADWLGSGGDRPAVVNVSLYDETTSSYFTTVNTHRQYNINYTDLTTSQSLRFAQAVAQQQGAGRTVSRVSVQLGANDLLDLIQQPDFPTLPPFQQLALIGAVLDTVQTNLTGIFGQIRTTLPAAEIIAVGYYNPFAAIPGHPAEQLGAIVVPALNDIIAGIGAQFGARYADTYTAFSGREGELTYMLTDPPIGLNVHPNDAGYAVIAGTLIPTPASLMLFITVPLFAARRRRAA